MAEVEAGAHDNPQIPPGRIFIAVTVPQQGGEALVRITLKAKWDSRLLIILILDLHLHEDLAYMMVMHVMVMGWSTLSKLLLSVPSARKQRFFINKFRSSETAEGRMYTKTSPPAGSKL